MSADDELFDLDSIFEVEDYLYFYAPSLTDERSDREVAGIITLLEMQPPLNVLDLACGFGRHANRLAALGFTVTGVDTSAGFLALARAPGAAVRYLQADMRSITFEGEFDRVLLLFTAFGYFEHAQNQRVLHNIAMALKPGGRLAFDIPNRDVTLKSLTPVTLVEINNDLMINRSSFDMLTGRWNNQRIVIRDGVRKDKPFSIQLYNPTQIQNMLADAGLEVLHLYADWSGQPLTPDARGMAIIAQKPF